MKRLLSIIVAMIMVIGTVFSTTGFAKSRNIISDKERELEYRIIDGKYAEIVGAYYGDEYECKDGIPAELGGYPVTSIGDRAFQGVNIYGKLIIPETVTYIGDYAFAYGGVHKWETSSLKEVVIPPSVTHIGDYAFSGCSKLTKIKIPSGVLYIGKNAFADCDKITSVVFPGTVRKIWKKVFADCDNLKKITINSGINELPVKAFYNCPNLNKVTLYDDVKFSEKAVGYTYNSKAKKDTVNKNVKIHIIEKNTNPFNCYATQYAKKNNLKYLYYLSKTQNTRLEGKAGLTVKLKIKGEKVKKWTSSNKKVATINNNGKVKTLSKGTTTLTAICADGTKHSRKLKVTAK
jgi:hypothetical protein